MAQQNFVSYSDMKSIIDDLVMKISVDGSLKVLSNAPVIYNTSRWLRFDPSNKKGLIIKAGTFIRKSNGDYFIVKDSDYSIDFSGQITTAGADYFVNLSDSNVFSCTTTKLTTGVNIGRFHTLCVDAGTMTMTAPASPSSGLSVGGTYLVKSYREDLDPDFYAFYNKTITAKTVQSAYDVITMRHPLSGYSAKDILPESVMCINFQSASRFEDAQVYDKDMDRFVDVYIGSGTGLNTRSKYNAVHSVSRTLYNLQNDQLHVGKRALLDYEFTSAALGSNEKTSIYGSADQTYVGGHSDTANRRMISAIGCEEMCGYVWQVLSDVAPAGGSSFATTDTHGSFGQEYGDPYVLLAGGHWTGSSSCGSCARSSATRRSYSGTGAACRGSSHRLTEK